MANLQEKLSSLYPGKKPEHQSWIPQKDYSSPEAKLRKRLENEQKERDQDDQTQALLNQAVDEIFACVEEYLFDRFGAGPEFENRLENFSRSFEHYFEKKGAVFVWALGEMTEEMNFLKQNGYLVNEIVEKKIEEIERREKRC